MIFRISFRPTMTAAQLHEEAEPYDISGWLRIDLGDRCWGMLSEDPYFDDSGQGVWLISFFRELARICLMLCEEQAPSPLYLHDVETPHEGLIFTPEGEFVEIEAICAAWHAGSGALCNEAPEILSHPWPHAIPIHLHDLIREVKTRGAELISCIGSLCGPHLAEMLCDRLQKELEALPDPPEVPSPRSLEALLAELSVLSSSDPRTDALLSEIVEAIQDAHPEYSFTGVHVLGDMGIDRRIVIYQDNAEHLSDFSTFSAAEFDGMNGVFDRYRVETVSLAPQKGAEP